MTSNGNLETIRSESQFFNSFLGGTQNMAQKLEQTLAGHDLPTVIGWITPITRGDLLKSGMISDFSRWRDQNQSAYPTRFVVTEEGTTRWLDLLLKSQSRLLFSITDADDRRVGHIGLAWNRVDGHLEVDSALLGEKIQADIMSRATEWLEGYAYREFNAQSIYLRVLKSNSRAVAFYERLGYVVSETTPLSSSTLNGVTTLNPDEIGTADSFLTMQKSLELTRAIPDEILTAGPSIGFREMAYVADAVSNGWNRQHSGYLASFQDQFSTFVGSEFSLATSSCTGAIHLALAAVGVTAGDEVIVPAVTWVATASAVRYTGATPIFADVNRSSWTLDPEEVKRLITPKTKAVIAVHLYGFVADVSALRKLADDSGIFLIEDAAPAIGATQEGRSAGTFGHFGCYSFQGAKLLVTGEGGMLVTDSAELFNRAVKLQEHGRKPGTFWIDELGYKYKMSNLTASLGLAQLQRADAQIEKKRRINNWYRSSFASKVPFTFQLDAADTQGIAWMTSIVIDEESGLGRDRLMEFLKENGIDSRPTFPSLIDFGFWDRAQEELPISKQIGSMGLNLPSGVGLSKPAVDRICDLIRSYVS